MNLRHIEFVVAAAAEQSFSRAAARCHVTQPTLSSGIALLESEFGGQLFVRTTRKVELSPFGRQVMPLIEALCRAHAELKAGVQSFYDPQQRLIRIGLSPLVDARRVAQVLEPFEAGHAGCGIFYKECFLGDLEARLQAAQLDIVIRPVVAGAAMPRSVIRSPFYVEDLYYLPSHAASAVGGTGGEATLTTIAGELFVLGPDGCGLSAITRGLFKAAGARLREYSGQALSYQVMQDWADIGIGATILPASKIAPQYRKRASRLVLRSKRRAAVSFEVLWMRDVAYPRHIVSLHRHFLERVPRLVAGSVQA